VRREAQRAVQLLAALVDWELTREPFAPSALEWPQQRVLAGATLRLRLDRVDRLADGSLIVIDYKTGAPESFDPLAPRPTQPQLPAYALVAGEQTAAVLALYLGPHGLKLRGVADRADRLSGLRPLPDGAGNWASLMQRWDQQLSGLVQEFLSGQARVQPQPGACKRCHLQAFCRIDAAAMRA
jgi:ATP-dependent helicase/DNAse subunit B